MRASRIGVLGLILLTATLLVAQNGKPKVFRRAKPPTFSKSAAKGVFYDDIFTEGVQGQRPADLGKPMAPGGGGGNTTTPGGAPMVAAGKWSTLIQSSTIEDEIKKVKLIVDQSVSSPTQFQSRGYRVCRKHFSTLAIMFAIISEYDGDVRWKKQGPGLRDTFSRTANNCKSGAVQVYNEAKLRKEDLQNIISGSPPDPKVENAEEYWAAVCQDRSPLMMRLETAQQERLQPMTANEASFQENSEEIYHEAQIVAALSEVLQQEGLDDAGDEDYDGYAEKMKQAALQIIEAVKSNDQAKASKGVGAIGQACSECHELYRG